MPPSRSLPTLAVVGWAVALAGCGGGAVTRPGATVSRAVAIDGTPVARGTVQFVPDDLKAGPPVSGPIADGRYTVAGVGKGKGRAVVQATRETGKMITDYSTPFPEVVSIVPEKARDGVPVTIDADVMTFDLNLSSK